MDKVILLIEKNNNALYRVRKKFEHSCDFRKIPMLIKEQFYKLYDKARNYAVALIDLLESYGDDYDRDEFLNIYRTWSSAMDSFYEFSYGVMVKTYNLRLGSPQI